MPAKLYNSDLEYLKAANRVSLKNFSAATTNDLCVQGVGRNLVISVQLKRNTGQRAPIVVTGNQL